MERGLGGEDYEALSNPFAHKIGVAARGCQYYTPYMLGGWTPHMMLRCCWCAMMVKYTTGCTVSL